MKRLATFLTAVSAILAMCGAPRIHWLTTEHNFGAFNEDDGKVSCRFSFVNTGDEAVSIVSVRAGCGCTTPTYPTGAIAPGDTAAITVTFNPVGRAGRFEKKVYVTCNTVPARTDLLVKGVVIGSANTIKSRFPSDAGPLKLRGDLITFGEVKNNHTQTFYLDAYNTSTNTLTPLWSDLPPYITVNSAMGEIAPGDYHTFAISFDSSKCKQYGIVSDKIRLYPGGDKNGEPFELNTVAIVNEDFSRLSPSQLAKAPKIKISPTRVELGEVSREQETVTCRILISNEGKNPLLLRRVYSADTGVDVTDFPEKIKKGQSATATVNIKLSEITSNIINARISIVSNAPESPTTIVRITGEIAE